MSEHTVNQICFDFFSSLPIFVEPKEVDVSSDAGILPIRQFDDQIGFSARFMDVALSAPTVYSAGVRSGPQACRS